MRMRWVLVVGAVSLLVPPPAACAHRSLQRGHSYKISPKPCSVNGVEGTCMFVWECIKSEGRHVGMCVDTFMFGSCCAHNESSNEALPPPQPPPLPNAAHSSPAVLYVSPDPPVTSASGIHWSSKPASTWGVWQPSSTEPPFVTRPRPRPRPPRPTRRPTSPPPTTPQPTRRPTPPPPASSPPTRRPALPPPASSTPTRRPTPSPPTTSPPTRRPPPPHYSFGAAATTVTRRRPTTTTTSTTTTTTTTRTTTTTTTTPRPTTTTTTTTTPRPTSPAQPSVSTVSATGEGGVQCGVPPLFPRPEMRIVGGKNAPFGGWPWQVSVRRTSFFGFSSTHRCGGALLNENWIATAGHCVDDLLTSQIRIRVGEYDFSSVQEPLPFVERGVSRKVVHPRYNFFTYEHDLALVQLERALEFAPHIAPICLPASDDLLVGENATVTGWGRLSEGGTLPSVLQEVSVPIAMKMEDRTLARVILVAHCKFAAKMAITF